MTAAAAMVQSMESLPLAARVTGGSDSRGGGDGPVVVLLHGFGAPGDDLVALSGVLDMPEGTRFVFPEAPLELPPAYMGGRAWWWIDLEARMRRRVRGEAQDVQEVPEGLHEVSAKVNGFLSEIERVFAPAPGKLLLGGFSQGAMLALDVALRYPRALAGVVLMSATHIASGEWEARYEPRRGLPVFMSHGREDELLPFATSEALKDTLVAHGLPVTWHPFRGGHTIPQAVLDEVSDFAKRVLA